MEKRTLLTVRGPVCYWVSHVENAPALVLLHGLTADHTLFDRQAEAWEGTYTLLAWDAPAHGASRPYEGFDYQEAVDHLRTILDIEGITRATFIGQSMGGFIAQAFLAQNPAYGEGFISVDSCPLGLEYYTKSDRWGLPHAEAMTRLYPLSMLRWSMVHACARTPAARDNMRSILAPYTKDVLCRLIGYGCGSFFTINRDIMLPCNVLLLVGAHDHTGKVRAYNEAWHRKTGYPLVIVPNAAHNANADNPTFVNAQVEAFLCRQREGEHVTGKA